MKKLFLVCLSFLLLSCTIQAQAASNITVTVNGVILETDAPPVVQNNRMLLPVRPVAEKMGLQLAWAGEERITSVWNDDTMVRLKIGNDVIEINGALVRIDAAPIVAYDRTYIPARAVVEAFGATVEWNGRGLDISYAGAKDVFAENFGQNIAGDMAAEPAMPTDSVQYRPDSKGKFFYSQPQSEWAFENGGRGYCWVCSYAMLISNVKGEAVTPKDVAAFNMEEGGKGSYMRSHGGVVERFGVRFVPALAETSPYFAKYESWRGGTYLNVASDEDAVNALKEALDRNPQGVIVRYEGYPHSMVAVGYVGDEIYFYEPAYTDGEWVPFARTCLKNYKLSDISYMQAIA